MKVGLVVGIGIVAQSVALYAAAAPAPAPQKPAPAAASREAEEFFEKSVRPVLVEKCFSCHGTKAQFAGLRLDSLAGIKKGTDTGKQVLVPGDPTRSSLIQVLNHTGAIKMPPQGKLPQASIDALAAWVKMGAPWPEAPGAPGTQSGADAAKKHWSFQPVRKPALPKVKNVVWARNPVDRFVLARLESKGLQPARPADRRTLIRRVTFDLTGLPPSPQEISDFVADTSPQAWQKVVDRLLASPHYGERWGRMWLDVARYSDTLGYLVPPAERRYPYSYTYRDYVIRAFNEDKPYDQFIKEQIAADQLELKDKRDLAALGFLTVGSHFLGSRQEIIDDQIDVVTRGFQGMTVQCARCHDHKYDPIPTADYYSLYGVFNASNEPGEFPQISDATDKSAAAVFAREYAATKQKIDAMRTEKKDVSGLERELQNLVITHAGSPPRAMVLADQPKPGNPRIFLRGNPGTPGAEVPRQYLAAVLGEKRQPFTRGSGRLDLAEVIATPENPLTARVMVNRVWLGHFGQGLVNTPSDFGLRGENPSHPELLDWLATTFATGEMGADLSAAEPVKAARPARRRSRGKMGAVKAPAPNTQHLTPSAPWSVKSLHRLMLLSNTYQQSSEAGPAVAKADPDNRLLSHFSRRRLDFEQLRDAMLAVTGTLDETLYGRSVNVIGNLETGRRTVYAFIDRQDLPTLLRTFDYPDANAHSGARFSTVVPQQSLFLMNNEFVQDRARKLLDQPVISSAKTADEKIKQLYRALFGRLPAPEEVSLGQDFLKRIAAEKEGPSAAQAVAWKYGYGDYDPAGRRLNSFTALPHFTGNAWQGGPTLPDPTLGWVMINPNGGHAGNDAKHSTVRRWVAPRDLVVRVRGSVRHGSDQGDGIHAVISSSRGGVLADWMVKNGSAEAALDRVALKRGDTLDFVVEPRATNSFDSFTWDPALEVVQESGPGSGFQTSWSASGEFAGPTKSLPKALTPWQAYAQALMLTNEFVYVD